MNFTSPILALVLAVFCTSSLAAQADFAGQAGQLKGEEKWAELVALASEEAKDGESKQLAMAYAAVGHAGLKQFDQAYQFLAELQQSGVDLDAALTGIGSPMVEVVNTIYAHCWSNFDPAFNRKCWQPLFEQFEQSQYSPIAGTRLLMASLKEGKEDEVKRYVGFFEARLKKAQEEKDAATEADLGRRYVDGYLRASQSNARVMELAQKVWEQAWQQASEQYKFDGPMSGGELNAEQLQARRDCEIDTDNAFNTIALATYLSGDGVGEGHPLFEMEAQPSVRFEDVTEQVGLAGLRVSRVAAADFDNDGDADLCFCGHLFENRKGKFVNVSKERGVTQRGLGALFGDYDGDGNLDLLISKGGHPTLYRNLGKRGKFQFEDVTTASGLDQIKLVASPEGSAWVDFDDDGDLDLYFALYENPMAVGHPDVLVENLGNGKFADRSDSGVQANGNWCGRGVSPADVDGDGHSEIFVSNYRLQPNFHWRWQEGSFVDASADVGVKGVVMPVDGNYYGHTIGSCWGDVDNDGDLDLFSANLAHPRFIRQGFSNLSMLLINQGDGTFADEGLERGIRFQETHSDPAFIDFDNDGDLDLSLTCIYEGVPSALFQNDGNGNFQPVTFRANAAVFHGWGQAWLDIDNDGFLDVVYASSNGVRVLKNSGNDNHYMRVKLECKGKDSSAFGAIVTLTSMEAETPQTWTRHLLNARGTTSQDEAIVHFGLGEYGGRVEVLVRWPDSDKTQKKTPKPDRVYTFKQTIKAK